MLCSKSIAIIGSGITGVTAALLLADRGFKVVLIERNDRLMKGASYVNEGKIHLGFVYVNDPTNQSLDRMITVSVKFRNILERWIPQKKFDQLISDQFQYVVPKNSQVEPQIIEQKFGLILQKIASSRISVFTAQ